MPIARSAVAALCCSLLQACSHIPDPTDIPGIEPYAILQKVRCEVWQAVSADYPTNAELHRAKIGYGLTLSAQETGNQAATLDIVREITRGTLSLGSSAGLERDRKNEIITNIAEPIAKTSTADCTQQNDALRWKYPIIGELGMRDVIRRYAELSAIASIKAASDHGFQQKLTFKLKYSGGIKPGFAIVKDVNPTRTGLLDWKTDREDTHELIILIEPYVEPSQETLLVHIVNLKDLTGAGTKVTPKSKDSGVPVRPFLGRAPSIPNLQNRFILNDIRRQQSPTYLRKEDLSKQFLR